MGQLEGTIFRRGSTTYYWSSKFFPKPTREDIFKLYSFVRIVDDCVDVVPHKPQQFHQMHAAWEAAQNNPYFSTAPNHEDSISQRVIKNVVSLERAYTFDPHWSKAFWRAMRSDLEGVTYTALRDTLQYVHGSAEVIGCMLSRIMGLPPEAYEAAKMQGRAMQWINFVRDVAEDTGLGRCYFPKEDLTKFQLNDLLEETARANAVNFVAFMRFEIERYRTWQAIAEEGYDFIPRRLRIPIQTAAAMYAWTATTIEKDPFIVFTSKVRPAKTRLLSTAFSLLLHT